MNVNGKECRKRGISILLTLIMVLTTMMPAWAYGAETAGVSAVEPSSQESAGEAQAVPDEQQPGDEEENAPAVTDESGSSTQNEESGSSASGSTDVEKVQYFAVISSDRAGTENKDDAPYIEAGIVKLQENCSVPVKKDKLEKQSDGVYKGTQDLNDGSSADCSDDNSYEVALKNYYGDGGSARDGYRLEGIDINGYMIKMSEIEADRDHHIRIAKGSISGYGGDADAYVNGENGKDIGLSFAGSDGVFSSDLKVTFIFSDDAEKADNAVVRQDAVKAAAKAASKTGAAGAKAASSHENQVRVIVENTTYPKSEGALWDGTLVDTWVDLNERLDDDELHSSSARYCRRKADRCRKQLSL
ncbi:MAG: hypothetical protein V8R14_01775 [Clostridia bacterium]